MRQGYTVLVASDADEAIRLFERTVHRPDSDRCRDAGCERTGTREATGRATARAEGALHVWVHRRSHRRTACSIPGSRSCTSRSPLKRSDENSVTCSTARTATARSGSSSRRTSDLEAFSGPRIASGRSAVVQSALKVTRCRRCNCCTGTHSSGAIAHFRRVCRC